VQSEQALHKLGAVDRDLIVQRISKLLELRAKGELRAMLEFAAEDIVFELRGDWTAFPYSQPVRGKKALAEALTRVVIQFENLGSVVHDMVIDGDRVAIRRSAQIRNRGTGACAEVNFADFIRFRDGLVVEFTEIADSSALAGIGEH
jgi:ketosteroid isomerase-like protein